MCMCVCADFALRTRLVVLVVPLCPKCLSLKNNHPPLIYWAKIRPVVLECTWNVPGLSPTSKSLSNDFPAETSEEATLMGQLHDVRLGFALFPNASSIISASASFFRMLSNHLFLFSFGCSLKTLLRQNYSRGEN